MTKPGKSPKVYPAERKHTKRAATRVALFDPEDIAEKRRNRPLTAKEHAFAELWLASSGTKMLRDMAIEAGYSVVSASAIATRLTDPGHSPHVVYYIQKRQKELAVKYGTTLEKHMQDMMYIRDKAIEAGAWSAAVQAEYRRGQALGTIYVDRKEIRHGTIDSMSKEEVQRKLEELRKTYRQSPQVIDVEDVDVLKAVDAERDIDRPMEGLDEAGESLLSEIEEGDDEDEDNAGRVVGESRDP